MLPGATRSPFRVEHDERAVTGDRTGHRHEPSALQMVCRGKSRLPRADHEDVDGLHVQCNTAAATVIPAVADR